MEGVGAAVVAGCNGPPVLLSGKEILDFMTLTIQYLAVMGWFLAAATGRNARPDALLGQHLTDFVPVIPLIPHHHDRRRQVFEHHIGTGEATALPLRRWSRRGTTFAVTDLMELAGHAPLGATNQAGGHPPFVEAGRRGTGFETSGVNHQHLWLWGIRRLCGVGC